MKNKYIFLQIVLIALFLASTASFADDNGGNFRITAPQFSSSPKIDGTLDNPVWEEGVIIDSFTQYEPQEGSEPTAKICTSPCGLMIPILTRFELV